MSHVFDSDKNIFLKFFTPSFSYNFSLQGASHEFDSSALEGYTASNTMNKVSITEPYVISREIKIQYAGSSKWERHCIKLSWYKYLVAITHPQP